MRTYVGRKTVALVGPNEAGKSSFLAALRLFDNAEAVPPASFSRSMRGEGRHPQEDVVVLWFALTEEQVATLRSLPLQTRPTHYRVHKKVGGEMPFSFFPFPVLSDSVTIEARNALPRAIKAIRRIRQIDEEHPDSQFELDSEVVTSRLPDTAAFEDGSWDRLFQPAIAGSEALEPALTAVLKRFDEWARPNRNIQRVVRSHLDVHVPAFAMFSEPERAIRADYALNDPAIDQSVALTNLLDVADLNLEHLRAEQADQAYVKQLIDEANDRLRAFFADHWRQEQIAVGLNMDGGNLKVLVKDLKQGSAGWLDITDRSDGLRVFIALATFLQRRNDRVPPILLIDEAEQHLHWNAQADLVQMLQNLDAIEQVIYTTHSPGCLPADLGNGVRFVEPVEGGSSVIRHDFWSLDNNSHVGFTPLLITMGAGAAAFSGLRRALLVEGAADMLLLPTLIKLATGNDELNYQIAPGIAVSSKVDMANLDLVASRVAFVIDGDEAGAEWRQQLTAAGVPRGRMHMLTRGVALEDLLDRVFYLDAVKAFLEDDHSLSQAQFDSTPIKAQLIRWGRDNRIVLPGPVSVVEHMLGRHESGVQFIKIKPQRKRTLTELHAWATRVLQTPQH